MIIVLTSSTGGSIALYGGDLQCWQFKATLFMDKEVHEYLL